METLARWSFVLPLAVVACGATGTIPADAGAPSGDAESKGDSASPLDAAPTADAGSGSSCGSAGDCRLYSDDCGGCTCVPLHADAPDPACHGTKVSCFVDPCEGKSAACTNGACVAP